MGEPQVTLLKQDQFGRVERVEAAQGVFVRRVACGNGWPLTRALARLLARRERAALRVLAGLPGVPTLVGLVELPGETLRTWIEGRPLSQAEELPEDFFEHLDELVASLHARGVCHNDLHKEQNVLVGPDGAPHLVDFQLASIHRRGGRVFAGRCREDLRHVEKHRRRYTRAGRAPQGAQRAGRGQGLERSWIARLWRRGGKPLYHFVTRRLLGTRDGEPRRSEQGPWPVWRAPLGPRGRR